MNEILYHLCRHCVSIMDGWYPFPSTVLSKLCGLSLYKTRKELKRLKQEGFVISQHYSEYSDWDCQYHLYNGYTITTKAHETEEYKKAFEEERKLVKECFGYDLTPY